MGAHQSSREDKSFEQDEVNFDHFQILRAIGKGSFGKVCIVQKKDSKQMFAMKYMNKQQCLERDALKNVLREVEILTRLEHPFLVNLWFSFQDEEDLFMVSDLMLGGDLRYHINQEVKFSENCVKLCVSELALALDYLQTKHIVHRDIKPDNILLDEAGHAHLADFNIATILDDGRMASSLSGTKPYIAPEVFECAADNTNTTASSTGYGFPVDWWSLGVCAYELLRGVRPFDIRAQTPLYEVRVQLRTPPVYLTCWSADIVDMLSKLLCVSPGERISSLEEYSKLPFVRNIDMDIALKKGYRPPFTPAKDHLNCDPTFELEEMIIETKPLHKKKKRLAKQRSIKEVQDSLNVYMDSMSPVEIAGRMIPEFIIYNRSQEMERREREQKEQAWEKELLSAMNESEPEVLPQKIRTCKSCSRLHEHQNVETRNSKSANEKLNEQTGNSETNVSDHVPTSSSEHYLHGDSTKYQDDTNVQASSKKHIPDYSQHVQASYMHGNCKKYISGKCEHVPTSSSDQYLHEECKKHISENCQQGQASSSDNSSKKCISDKSKHVLASSCDKKCNSSKSDHALASSCDNCGKKYISDKCEHVMASSSDRHLQADYKKHQFKRKSGDSSCNVLQTSEEIFLKTCDITDHLLSDIDYIDRTPSTGSNA